MALKRFLARRGSCKIIYSDNAASFKQTDKLLKEVTNQVASSKVQNEAVKLKLQWRFIVARAPWWGGFYERLIGSIKGHLRRTLGRALLTYEELETVLIEIEAVINSRPLTYVSADHEQQILTPAHFLLGEESSEALNIQPDQLSKNQEELGGRWRYQQRLLNGIWQRWRKEYLMQLRSAHQQKDVQNCNLKEGSIAILHEDKLPRLHWKMARILQLIPGRDGKIRSAILQTASGDQLRRAIQHIYPLEVE
jgi:hypothetical protein